MHDTQTLSSKDPEGMGSIPQVDLRHLRRQAKKARKRANLKARKQDVLAEKARELDELDQLITNIKVQFGELPSLEMLKEPKLVPHVDLRHLRRQAKKARKRANLKARKQDVLAEKSRELDELDQLITNIKVQFGELPAPEMLEEPILVPHVDSRCTRMKAKKSRKRAHTKARKQNLPAEKASKMTSSEPSSPRIPAWAVTTVDSPVSPPPLAAIPESPIEASRQKSPAHAVPVTVPSSTVLSISPSGELTIGGESMVATPLEKRTARICEVTFISPTYTEYLRELSPLPELVNAQPLQEQSLAELLMSPPIARPFCFSTPVSISPFCQIQFGTPVPSRGNEVVPASPTQLTNHSEESDAELELDVLSPSWFKTPPRSALRELNFGESPVGIEKSVPANELQASEEEPAPSNVVRELALASKEGAEAPTSNIRSAFARVVKGLRRAVKGLLGFFRQRFVCMF